MNRSRSGFGPSTTRPSRGWQVAAAVGCALALASTGSSAASAAAAPLLAAPGSVPSAVITTAAPRLPALREELSVLGSPRRTVKGVRRAGIVELRRGAKRWVLTTATVGQPLRAGAQFGAAITTGLVTLGDLDKDLVVGVPGWAGGRGAVVVIPDFGAGLEPGAARWLPTGRIPPRVGDALGTSLHVLNDGTDANSDGVADYGATVLAGAPGRDFRAARDAGMLFAWRFPPSAVAGGVRPTGPIGLAQGHGGLLDRAETGDRFGSVMSAQTPWSTEGIVLIGVPEEDVTGKPDAGAVVKLQFARGALTGNEFLRLGSGLPLTPHAGDRLGAAVALGDSGYQDPRTGSIRIGPSLYGIPGLDSHGIKNAGAVVVERLNKDHEGSPVRGPVTVLTENSPGIPGAAERGDRFGSALAAVFAQVEDEGSYLALVAVGVPGENVGRRKDSGSVVVIPGDFLGQSVPIGPSKASVLRATGLSRGDRFGERLSVFPSYDYEEYDYADQLLIGAPGEDRPRAKNAGRYYRWNMETRLPKVFANGTSRSERLGGQ